MHLTTVLIHVSIPFTHATLGISENATLGALRRTASWIMYPRSVSTEEREGEEDEREMLKSLEGCCHGYWWSLEDSC
jgi:hypothetical protein